MKNEKTNSPVLLLSLVFAALFVGAVTGENPAKNYCGAPLSPRGTTVVLQADGGTPPPPPPPKQQNQNSASIA